MDLIKAIIVDDETNARDTVKKVLKMMQLPVEVIDEAADASEGIAKIKTLKPDLVFLDIEMPGKNGVQMLEEMQPADFEVIFITAYHDYAIKAFRFSAIDYLLKPIDPDELQVAVQKVQTKKQVVSATQIQLLQQLLRQPAVATITQPAPDKIALSTAEGIHFVLLSEIIWMESLGAYTKFHIEGQKPIIVSRILKEYEDLLKDYSFVRIHQSSFINIDHIKKYVRGDGGQVWMSDGTEIEVSRRKKDELFHKMEKNILRK